MAKIIVREKETLEDAMRRFKRDVAKAGTLAEARKKEYYVKPGVERKQRLRASKAKARRSSK